MVEIGRAPSLRCAAVETRIPQFPALNTVTDGAASVDEVDISVKVAHGNGVELIVVVYDASANVVSTRVYYAKRLKLFDFMACRLYVCSIVLSHALRLAVFDGTELLEVSTAVVEHETGDVARAVAAVEANRASSSTARVTRRRRSTVVQILVE